MTQQTASIHSLTPEQLAKLQERLRMLRGEAPAAGGIRRRTGTEPVPLSFAQQRLWFVDRLEPGNMAYNTPIVLRLRGRLDRGVLARSLSEVVRRHETLRTSFPLLNGEPVQAVAPAAPLPLPVMDLSTLPANEREREARRLAGEEAARPFSLELGPLLRVTLLRLAPEEHVVLFTVHHVISDAWSIRVLMRELTVLYDAFSRGEPSPLPELPVQYADYTLWQRERVSGALLGEQLAYWRKALAGAPPVLELPTDRPRTPWPDPAGAVLPFFLPAETGRALAEVAQREGATLFMVMMAAWQLLLGRWAGQDDVVVGSPIANRTRREVEGLIGLFANTLALRGDLSGDPTFVELLGRVREATLGAHAHQDLPFERLVQELDVDRDAASSPLFQAMLVFGSVHAHDTLRMGDVEVLGEETGTGSAMFDLLLQMSEYEGVIQGTLDYRTSLFDATTIARLLGHYRMLLEAVAADPSRRISALPLLTADERRRVVTDWNATAAEYPADACIHHLFAQAAARAPDAPAVAFAGGSLSYAELDARSNRLARHLRGLGVGPETRVGISLERGPEMMAAVLAVLKAGGAYVPVDPAYPAERIAWMLADAAAPVLLTTAELAERLPSTGARVVRVDADAAAIAAESADVVDGGARPDNLAYVIYTSGSTGRPKGVAMPHRPLVNLLAWQERDWVHPAASATLQFTTLSFDVSFHEIFSCWISGGALLLVTEDERRDFATVLRRLDEGGIERLFLPYVALQHLAEVSAEVGMVPRSLREVQTAGEQLRVTDAIRRFFSATGARLSNHYGPTETHVATALRLEGGPQAWPLLPSIGRPIANATTFVVEKGGEPAPVGVPGELLLGGVCVARGYLGRPALTAERFIPDPFGAAGARVYRTGDRARWLADGTLEFLGRADDQVKVRGYRIEPGEIEAALESHPAVREAVVVAREEAPGDRRLVAYVVSPAGTAAPAAHELRAHLAERLPEYMVPSAFVALDAFPLTPSGKVARRELPAPVVAMDADEDVPLDGPVQEAVARVFAEVLHVPRVGARDHFFALGGHSLLATRLVSRMREAFGIELPLRAVFDAPTVERLAAEVEALRGADVADRVPPLVPLPRDGALPLSFSQQRLWFIDQLEPGSAAYNLPYALRLRGPVDADALERALAELARRHESLRTRFVTVDGQAAQVIDPAGPVQLARVDLSDRPADEREAALRTLVAEEALRPFDLAAGPLMRSTLVRLGDEDHALLFTLHHIISDGWSTAILVREVAELYGAFTEGRAPSLPDLPVQYADYAAWQRGWLRGEVLEAQVAYWRQRLAGAPPVLDLPTDRPRPPTASAAGGAFRFRLRPETSEALRALGAAEGATMFMTLLAAWQALLSRYAGQADVVVGTPIAGRGRLETEGLIGFFVNTLVLRSDVGAAGGFRDLVRQVREHTLGAYAHQDVPFERLVEELAPERRLGHAPLYQVMFDLVAAEPGAGLETLGRARVEELESAGSAVKDDLMLVMGDGGRGVALDGVLLYRTELFDRATMQRMAAHLSALLDAVAADPDAPLARVPLLTPAERESLDAWNATDRGYPAGALVHDLFAAQVARTPEAPAVVFDGEPTSYAELDARANRLANHLRTLGVGVETRVGVCLDRTPELIVSLLAVLKAGGTYVPLDPAYPRERLGYMTADAGVRFVLTTDELADRLPAGAEAVRIDTLADRIAAESAEAPRVEVHPENLSHVIFTSGSTGRPKGVMIRHSSTAILLHWLRENVSDEERGAVLGSTSINFDVSIAEIFGTLCWGGKLVLVENALDLPAVADQGIRYASMVPTAAAELLRAGEIPASVRTLNLGGEPLPNDLAQALYALGTVEKVGNLYGPTEDTTYSTYSIVERGADRVLVGRPVANTTALVLDAQLQPAPVGVVGELYLAGGGLSRGYAGHPALTAERFIPNPFGASGSRMYRVMDRIRWTASGELEYFGRTDFQVKVRGFRIELGEIETALRAHPSIADAVAIVREDVEGDRRLVAYLVAQTGEEVPPAAVLRAHLKERLPEYMVPSAFVPLDALPLTPNGKVDRRALPAPDTSGAADAHAYVAPRTETEERLAGIFADVLGVERVGVHDDFFVAGGHSLLVVRAVTRVRASFGVELPIRAMFEAHTVAELATRVDALLRGGATASSAPILPVSRDRPIPLSFAQQRLWFIQQLDPANVAYNMMGLTRMDGVLHAGALQRAVDTVVERHEALRTVFVLHEGGPVQQVVPGMRITVEVEDLQGLDAAEQDAQVKQRARAVQAVPFDLATGPLLRALLLRLAPETHVLVLVMHHVISDGWSRGVVVDEISAAYTAIVNGEAPRLPDLPVQYPDYAVWQRERLQGAFLAEQLDYWRQALAGVPPVLALPTDHPRPPIQSFAGRAHRFDLPAGIEEPLQALAHQEGATLFMVLLAAFQCLLARYSGQADLVVGTPVANRGRGEVEGLVGFFVNMLALRTDLSGDPTFREALRRVREAALGAYAHDEVPFERLVEELGIERSLSRNQIFQVVFQIDEFPPGADRLAGVELSGVSLDAETATFDLTLAVGRDEGELVGRLEYSTALFDPGTAERMAGHLNQLLRNIAAAPDTPISALEVTDAAERSQVAEWNATERDYPAAHVHELFAAQAARTPDAPALAFRGETLSYAELDARANRLANHLRRLGAGVETRIGVCLERTPELIVSLIAVHKAGGAYVPMDPAYPRERLGFMVEDAGLRLVITSTALAGRLPDGVEPVCLDAAADAIAAEPAEAPRVHVDPENLSHVIFTSGSTGRPKGVMIRHHATAVLVHWLRENVTDEERASALASTSVNFDVSVGEIFGALCWGGKLVLVENALDLPSVAGEEIRYVSVVPTAAAELLRSGAIPASVRTFNLCGEALPNELAQGLYALGTVEKVGNLYGPTEDTTYSTYSLVPHGADRVLVGVPLANSRTYVLDHALRPTGVGIVGEAYLAGAGLARGYAGRPGLTAERFLPDPFGPPGSRMYRVMDLVRWTAAGELEYFGRTDFQVKIRGFRIELGEIETILSAHPGVREVVVTAWDDGTGERRLVAYVTTPAGAEPASATELRRWVGDRLPAYMVPSIFVPVDAIPQTPNGKTDRRALPDPGPARPELEVAYAPPRNDLEAVISEAWREVLGVERVGIRDNFFDLGGTSVRLATLHRLLVTRLQREVTVVDLFRYPTVAGLAEHLGEEDDGGAKRRGEVQDRAERQRQAQAARQQRGRAGRR
ncbi:MAG TPA: amino acid adenylation domain-containing protein [Longimicrobium sp.]|nr:amino acid adenylation domain-containing protein [Longimicrobium sp.]